MKCCVQQEVVVVVRLRFGFDHAILARPIPFSIFVSLSRHSIMPFVVRCKLKIADIMRFVKIVDIMRFVKIVDK